MTVARKRSFVLAAEELGLTQSAVSRSVRELEQIVDQELFDRSTRGAVLTANGRGFFDAAEAGLLHIAQGANALTAEVGVGERVRVGALPNVCSRFLPSVIENFKREAPGVMVRVVPGTNADLLEKLRRGETDFVIGRLSTSRDMRGLVFEALYDESLIFVVRSGHPLLASRASVQQVAGHPVLLPSEGTIIGQEVARFLASHGVMQPENVIETTSSEFQRAYLLMSDAVAIVSEGVVRNDLERGSLVRLPIATDEMRGPVGLTTNPDLRLGDAAQRLVQCIRVSS